MDWKSELLNTIFKGLKVALNTKTHNPDFDNNKKYFENLAI
jgi:Na+/H+-translocating membrane pyrophosphatase